jgi:membrane dipeptidase
VVGLEDVSDYWKITRRLMEEGYSRDDLEKIWGGNVLRVMRQAEDYKASLDQGR